MGTVLRHLEELGISLYADISDPKAMQQLLKLSSGDPDAVKRISWRSLPPKRLVLQGSTGSWRIWPRQRRQQ